MNKKERENQIREAYIKKILKDKRAKANPYSDNPYRLIGSPAKKSTSALIVERVKTDEKHGYLDGMELFNSLIRENKDNIELMNLAKFVEVMVEDSSLANLRYFDLFASESLPSVEGIQIDSKGDPNATLTNFKRLSEGKTVTKTYLKGLPERKTEVKLYTYQCTNDVQLAYAVILHCLRLEIKIKKCSECGKLFSIKSNSNKCESCRAENRNAKNNESKNRIEYRFYKAIYDSLKRRDACSELIDELKQGYNEFDIPLNKEEKQELIINRLAFLWDFSKREDVDYKPRSKARKDLVKEVERILREERNNGK